MAIHRSTIQWLSSKNIKDMSEKRLDRYLDRAKTLMKQNLKQYEKTTKQWKGKSAKEMFNLNYNDMQFILNMDDSTEEAKQKKLTEISKFMRKDDYTPTEAKRRLNKLKRGTYSGFFEDYVNMPQSDRRELYENVGAVFAKFSQDQIEKLGSDLIVQITAQYINNNYSYAEVEQLAYDELMRIGRQTTNFIMPETPLYEIENID